MGRWEGEGGGSELCANFGVITTRAAGIIAGAKKGSWETAIGQG